jgi:hypothetical protein
LYFDLPALYEGDNYHVEGVCVEAYSGKLTRRKSSRRCYIVLDNGVHYQLYGSELTDNYKDLEGKELSCSVSSFGFNDKIYAFDKGDKKENEKNLKEIKRSEIGRLILVTALTGFLAAIVIFIPPILELWQKHDNEINQKDMLKRRKQKHVKKRKQAEKYSSLETFTEERHIQNKNMSKKKQKQRMKRNKPSNKN